MSRDFETLERLFHRARVLGGSERERFLAEIDDASLVKEVRRLLRADEEPTGAMHTPIEAVAQQFGQSLLEAWIGRRLGSYEIIEEIAAGGMGAVFLARRVDEQFEARVAVKIMNGTVLSTEAVERFRAERQILASLNHPHIAKLLDGGTLDNGLPYLIMEYVDGLPVDEYCDVQRLDVRGRLMLFQKICEAVEHAHRNLVVHRDLKPSNILVDATGTPKLLDFGIAKLINDSDSPVGGVVTRPDLRIMTPEYASPEQVRRGTITTATDVYSLGVLLYRLLTGASPYRDVHDDGHSLEQAIVSQDPLRPSTAVASTGYGDSAPHQVIRRRQRRLRGDLDNITLMALRKDPERRYGSARSLEEDIRRYLELQPVRARADNWRYRATKFILRHKLGTAAAAVMAIVLVSFSIITLQQNRAIKAERDIANEVAGFMVETFTLADPESEPGRTVTARELLDNGRSRISNAMDSTPELRARLLQVMGEAYRGLSYAEEADALLEEAVELGRQGHLEPRAMADAVGVLARTRRFLGRFDSALALIDEAIARYQALQPEAYPALIEARVARANILNLMGEHEAALADYLQARPLAEALPEDPAGVLPDLHHNIGVHYMQTGRLDEAEDHLRQALDSGHPEWLGRYRARAFTLGVLGAVLRMQGEPEEALRLTRETFDILLEVFGEDHESVAATRSNLANIYMDLERFEDAAAEMMQGIAITRRTRGENHYEVASAMHNLAMARFFLGNLEEAADLLRESISIKRAHLPEGHQRIAHTEVALGRVYRHLGQLEPSEQVLEQALATYLQVFGERHGRVAGVLTELGYTRFVQGRLEEAEADLRRAVMIQGQESRPDTVAYTRGLLGRVLAAQGRCEAAMPHLGAQGHPSGPGPYRRSDLAALEAAARSCSSVSGALPSGA